VRLIVAALIVASLPASVSAQSARTNGVVRDPNGKPIKGATVRAFNPEIQPRQVVSTSDDKGRWAMLGMRVGTYTFVVDAPGFVAGQGEALVRTAAGPPLVFVLVREPGLVPGQLPSNIQAQITAAHYLRDQGRIDQAISAYQDIRTKYASLTSMNLVLAAAYRRKAATETDARARQMSLQRAMECYTDMLKADPDNEHAKAGLSAIRAETGAAGGEAKAPAIPN
jgi:hypothetical protein